MVVVNVWSHARILVPSAMHHAIVIMMTLYAAYKKREQVNALSPYSSTRMWTVALLQNFLNLEHTPG